MNFYYYLTLLFLFTSTFYFQNCKNDDPLYNYLLTLNNITLDINPDTILISPQNEEEDTIYLPKLT